MTTTLGVIERTKRHLYSGETRDDRDQLAAALTDSGESLQLRYGRPSVQQGATLAIGLEELYVYEGGVNPVVGRGEGGSTAAAHSLNDVVAINPKFSSWAILDAVNEELAALHAEGLFKVSTVSLTYVPGTDAYDLTSVTNIDGILSVDYDANDGTERWATLPTSAWRLRRDMPTADFASGLALTVNGYVAPSQPIRVSYRAPFTSLAATGDNVETVSGLPASAHDILPLGASIRLTGGNEIARNNLDQYETRRADEVPAGARLGMMRTLLGLRAQRIADEKARLYARYPVVR